MSRNDLAKMSSYDLTKMSSYDVTRMSSFASSSPLVSQVDKHDAAHSGVRETTIEVIAPVDNRGANYSAEDALSHYYLGNSSCRGGCVPSISNQTHGTNWSDLVMSSSSNSTEYYYAAKVVWQVCPVALFLFGTIGNLLILLTLRNLRLGRSSMHLYLRALAISDLLVLYTGLLRQWLAWTFDVDLRDQHVILCKLHTWLLHVTLYTSSWLLVVMTLERSCSACFPHRVSSFCTKRCACLVILVIVAFQLAIQSHFLIGLALVPNSSNITVCAASSTQYDFVVSTILPIADVVLLSLLPFLFVIVGNIVIVWRAFLSLKTAAELSLTFSKNVLQRKRRTSSMTIILIGLSAIFLLTTSPSCVYNLWELGGGDDSSVHGAARAELAWALVNILMYCNNTFNFYLYCLSGRKFRNEMRRQFSRPHTDSLSNAPSGVSVQMQRLAQSDVYNSSYSPLTYQTSLIARPSNAYL